MHQNTHHRNFESQLFNALAEIFPEITVRKLSTWLGKSECYWSSITSQNLAVSESALKHLSEFIECRIILLDQDDVLRIRLSKVQQLIAEELVHRFRFESEYTDSLWAEVSKTLNQELKQEPDIHTAMPYFFSIYGNN